jgi:protein-tyrosine phosphatase
MAEVVLGDLVERDDRLRGRVRVSSAGTARWHVGDEMDPRARRALDRAGWAGPGSAAAFADSAYLDAHDVVIVMTREHRADVLARLTRRDVQVILLRELLGETGLDLADPYYGDDDAFDECLDVIRRAAERWVEGVARSLGPSTP